MKRVIPLVVALFLVLTCALPASANEMVEEIIDSYWIDVLDYTQMTESGNYFKPAQGVSRFTVDLPYFCTVASIDMVVGCYREDVQLYIVHPRDGALKLNKVKIGGYGDKLYRFYLDIPVWDFRSLTIQCDSGGGVTWLEFHSFRVSTKKATSEFTPLHGTLMATRNYADLAKDPHNTNPAYHDVTGSFTDETNDFDLMVYAPNWRQFDFVDFQVYINCLSISSVVATHDDKTLPVEVSYISNSSFASTYLINVTLDLRSVNRSSSVTPIVTIEGNFPLDQNSYVELVDCYGIVLLDTVDPLYYRFKAVTDSINKQTQEIVAALSPPASDKITDYKDSASTQAGKVDAITDSMASVSRPDAGDLNFSMTGLVPGNAVDLATMPLTVILENKYFKIICIMSFTLCIAGYILFGKKG